jgi:hypothetical protein
VTSCSLGDTCLHFGSTCYLHLHIRRDSTKRTKDGLCLRYGNLSSISCKNARSILHRFLMMRFSIRPLEPAHTALLKTWTMAFVRVCFIFCFLFLSPYSALNTCSVLVFLPPTIAFIPSLLTSIYQPMVTQSHYFSHISILTEQPFKGPQIHSSFPLLLLVNSGLISHMFSAYIHTYSSTLKIPPKHQ